MAQLVAGGVHSVTKAVLDGLAGDESVDYLEQDDDENDDQDQQQHTTTDVHVVLLLAALLATL